ncbi:hypothetical protein PB01_18875 [Psychrobacillus glaciei]|uniref:Uncharacterized protein n=1 Tax=Psychrobacillus glaciei TaxID=2283160 RepID=A0A5J6SS48_9BACI|nr:hypothetical protein [Psychrobacillus glaciei]QFG00691.1 hypothetical protein PB01_18875 [Psychrobacillus glaciei]
MFVKKDILIKNTRNDIERVNRVLGRYKHHGGKEFVQNTFFIEAKNESILSTLKTTNLNECRNK